QAEGRAERRVGFGQHVGVGHDLAPPAPQLRRPARGAVAPPRVRPAAGGHCGDRRGEHAVSATELFTDERAVRGTSAPVMGMVLFVAGEAMFFAALFAAYFSSRAAAKVWPPAGIGVPDLPIPAVLTAILVSSSVVLQFAIRAVRRGH